MLVSRFQFIPILLSRSFEFLFQVFNFCGNFWTVPRRANGHPFLLSSFVTLSCLQPFRVAVQPAVDRSTRAPRCTRVARRSRMLAAEDSLRSPRCFSVWPILDLSLNVRLRQRGFSRHPSRRPSEFQARLCQLLPVDETCHRHLPAPLQHVQGPNH
jgi:hypothetical protein